MKYEFSPVINVNIIAENEKYIQELPKVKNKEVREKRIVVRRPSSLNPFYFFKLARFAKRCNVLHIILRDDTLGFSKGMLGLYYLMVIFIVKFPSGPAIIVTSRRKSFFHYPFRLFADFNLKKKPTEAELNGVYTRAFLLSGAGHPDSIYKIPIQKERINWLRQNARGSILEIGCATGYILNYCGGGTGLDIDKYRIEIAQKKYPKSRFVTGDATKMPFKNKEFDVVMIPEILEHVPMEIAAKIVHECERVGKKLLITVPNAGKKNYDKDLVENPEHLWFPTSEKMRKMIGENTNITTSRNEDFLFITKGKQ